MTLAEFVKEKSLGKVHVHLSSDPGYEGPGIGRNLNAQLREALFEASAVLLIYTEDDKDWSYCMWECGVAIDANHPEAEIIVFQCGRDTPKPFEDDVRVNVRSVEDIERFTKFFLQSERLFPEHGGALAPGLDSASIKKFADELHKNLEKILPPLDPAPTEEWATWPSLLVEIPAVHFDEEARDEYPDETLYDRVRERAMVVEHNRVAALLRMASLPPNLTFGRLEEIWEEKSGKTDTEWFESCCDQMKACARREFPIIRHATMQSADLKAGYIPIVGRIRDVALKKLLQFEIYFYNLSDPRAVDAAKKMVPIEKMYFRVVDDDRDIEKITLSQFLDDLEGRGLNRVPFVDSRHHPIYIVHKSMVTDFMLRKMRAGVSLDELRLKDLFEDVSLKEMFAKTFAVVPEHASIEEARNAMRSIPSCQDVFVTASGGSEESILGLLTNQDLVEAD